MPDGWDSSRAAPFVANFLVVALVAPIVEELTYRGLGFAAVAGSYGPVAAIVVTAARVRARARAPGRAAGADALRRDPRAGCGSRPASLYPTMILHGVFNGAALIAAVTT